MATRYFGKPPSAVSVTILHPMSTDPTPALVEALRDRRVIVIGASSGIGRAAARCLSAWGASVVLVGRRRHLLEELVEEMGAGFAVDADLRDPEQCHSLVERAAGKVGQIDALVFAASASTLAMTADAGADVWRMVLDTNVMAPALVTRSLLPHLTPGAFLGYLSSEIVGQPYHGLAHYAASKAALEELVRALRVEHPLYRFCCIRVGATPDTDFARDFSPELAAELFPQWIARAKLPSSFMNAHEVGSAIAGAVAIAFASPGVDVQDLTLRPPGGPMTGDSGNLVEMIAEVNATASSAPPPAAGSGAAAPG
jgi:NAD(P)-dependent dehydrogenase (short-subunit alcohol dehydrogenase family)